MWRCKRCRDRGEIGSLTIMPDGTVARDFRPCPECNADGDAFAPVVKRGGRGTTDCGDGLPDIDRIPMAVQA